MDETLLFALFNNCKLVKGYSRSAIYDLDRRSVHFIPNDLFDILTSYTNHSIKMVKSIYGSDNHKILDEYFQLLYENDLIFFTKKSLKKNFPGMDDTWLCASIFNNCIIEAGPNTKWKKIFDELDNVQCNFIQVRFTERFSKNNFDEFLNCLNSSNVHSAELIVPFNEIFNIEAAQKLLDEAVKITYLLIYSAEFKETIIHSNTSTMIEYILDSSSVLFSAPQISLRNFSFNITAYTEALKHNLYFNRKIAIDENGNVKIDFFSKKVFGNIYESSIKHLADDPEFTKFWHVKKDETMICKDCEFRYACVDHRIPSYLENEMGYIYDSKCGYDPYTAEWSGKEPLN